jgi:hypothetical protein
MWHFISKMTSAKFNKNGNIFMMKNTWQCCKPIWTYCFSVVSYYRFFNTDPSRSCKMFCLNFNSNVTILLKIPLERLKRSRKSAARFCRVSVKADRGQTFRRTFFLKSPFSLEIFICNIEKNQRRTIAAKLHCTYYHCCNSDFRV